MMLNCKFRYSAPYGADQADFQAAFGQRCAISYEYPTPRDIIVTLTGASLPTEEEIKGVLPPGARFELQQYDTPDSDLQA